MMLDTKPETDPLASAATDILHDLETAPRDRTRDNMRDRAAAQAMRERGLADQDIEYRLGYVPTPLEGVRERPYALKKKNSSANP